jgi:transcriptional regulator with XRE-family HTH domain
LFKTRFKEQKMDIGCRIKELRKKRGLNQPELGKIVNLTGSTISAIEIGKNNPTPDAIIRLCNFFEVSADYLLTGKEGTNDISEEEREILSVIRDDKAMRNAMMEVAKVKKKAISFTRSYAAASQNAVMG